MDGKASLALKPRILIFGNCTTRDAFSVEEAKGKYVIVDYYARSSLAGLYARPSFDSLPEIRLASEFQRKVVRRNLEKSFVSRALDSQYDLLIIDLIDERYDLVEICGGLVSLSNELKNSGLATEFIRRGRRIASGSSEFRDRWLAGMRALVRDLSSAGLSGHIALNQVLWATRLQDGSRFGFKTRTFTTRKTTISSLDVQEISSGISDCARYHIPGGSVEGKPKP